MSGEQLLAVNTWFKLIEIILLILHNAAPEVKPAVKSCRDLATRPGNSAVGGKGEFPFLSFSLVQMSSA